VNFLFKIYNSIKFPLISDRISRKFRNSREVPTGIWSRLIPGRWPCCLRTCMGLWHSKYPQDRQDDRLFGWSGDSSML